MRNIAILGFGVVGGGVAELLTKNSAETLRHAEAYGARAAVKVQQRALVMYPCPLCRKAVQQNAELPIFVTVSGISIFNDVQPLNIPSEMVVQPFAKTTSSRAVQPINASAMISDTTLSKTTFLSDVQFANTAP